MNRCAAVILAAGYGTRMGGRPKALLWLNRFTLLEWTVRSFRRAGIEDVRVVTGRYREATSRAARDLGVLPVHNPEFASGMFSSVQAGISSLQQDPDVGGAFFLPVDLPLVRWQTVRSVHDAWAALDPALRDRALLLPVFSGRPGHPPLLGSGHFSPAAAWTGPEGLRGYCASLSSTPQSPYLPGRTPHPWRTGGAPRAGPSGIGACAQERPEKAGVCRISVPDAGVLLDLDTPADHGAARRLLRQTSGRRTPLLGEAWELLRSAGLPEEKVGHSLCVALGALRLGLALDARCGPTRPELHVCGGLVHDVARAHNNHALAGKRLAAFWGWRETALVVGAHTALPVALLHKMGIFHADGPKAGTAPEAEQEDPAYERAAPHLVHACAAVYLADKYFSGCTPVSVQERFAAVRSRWTHDPAALSAIARRERTALAVEAWWTRRCPLAPARAVSTPVAHPLEDALLELTRTVP